MNTDFKRVKLSSDVYDIQLNSDKFSILHIGYILHKNIWFVDSLLKVLRVILDSRPIPNSLLFELRRQKKICCNLTNCTFSFLRK